MSDIGRLRELMGGFAGFVLSDDPDAPPIWTALGEGTEIVVAAFPEGGIQVARFIDGADPLLITFSAYDPSIGAVIDNWMSPV